MYKTYLAMTLGLSCSPPVFAAHIGQLSPAIKLDWSPYPLVQVDLPAPFLEALLLTSSRSLAEALLGTETEMSQLPDGREGVYDLNAFLAKRRIEWPRSDFVALPWRVRVQFHRLGLRSKADLFCDAERLPDMLADLKDLNPDLADVLERAVKFWQCERDFESKK